MALTVCGANASVVNHSRREIRYSTHFKLKKTKQQQTYPYWTVYPLMSTGVQPPTVTNSSNQPFLFSEVGTQSDSDTKVMDSNPKDNQIVVTTPDFLLAVDSITSGIQEAMNVNYQGDSRITTYMIQALYNLPQTMVYKDTWTFTDMIGGPPSRVDGPSVSYVIVQLGPPSSGGTGGGGKP